MMSELRDNVIIKLTLSHSLFGNLVEKGTKANYVPLIKNQ